MKVHPTLWKLSLLCPTVEYLDLIRMVRSTPGGGGRRANLRGADLRWVNLQWKEGA